MNWVNQIISAVEAGGKVVGPVFLSCAAALALEQFFPDSFLGLPEWVFPTIRIVAIFSLVLSITAILPTTISWASAFWKNVHAPIRRRCTQRKLLGLEIFEVIILCKAIAEQDRTILVKPDMAAVISLQDKGLISFFRSGALRGDDFSHYQVPMEVWRVLLLMEEFSDFEHQILLSALEKEPKEAALILASLPQAHPAVRAETEQQAA